MLSSHPSNFTRSYVIPLHPVLFLPQLMHGIYLILLYTIYSGYRSITARTQRKVGLLRSMYVTKHVDLDLSSKIPLAKINCQTRQCRQRNVLSCGGTHQCWWG